MLLELGPHQFDVASHALVMTPSAMHGEGSDGQPQISLVDPSHSGDTPQAKACCAHTEAEAQAALQNGAHLIGAGDLGDPMILTRIADADAAVWVSVNEQRRDPVAMLAERARWAEAAGLRPGQIVMQAPLDRVAETSRLGYPVLVAVPDDEHAAGRQVAAAMGGARIVLTRSVRSARRTLFTVGELLARRGVTCASPVMSWGAGDDR